MRREAPFCDGGAVLSEVTVGPPADEAELQALAAQRTRTYNQSPDDARDWAEQRKQNLHDLRVVRADGKVAGGLVLLPMGQFFGGRSVPMTGIGGVGIEPEHRASGLASALMRSVVEELEGNGCALSALYPATVPVYRRVGYELAGSYLNYAIESDLVDVRDRELTVELSDDAETFKTIYQQRARTTSGNLDRSDYFWERLLDPPKTTQHRYVVGGPDGPEGYVLFTQPSPKGWMYDLALRDIVALTPRAARRLWTFFADHRSFAGKVKWTGPAGDPFTFPLREQAWELERSWSWMLRITNVERALTERGYAPTLETGLGIKVVDDVLETNNATFTLEVGGGKGQVARNGKAEITIDVRGLAPLYTGFITAESLRLSGYIEGSDEALSRASAIFAGPAPWLADFF
jgi:predicted acetyltransferase